MGSSRRRRTAAEREREGAMLGGIGVALALLGLVIGRPGPLVIGVFIAVIGGVMWAAGMARSDDRDPPTPGA